MALNARDNIGIAIDGGGIRGVMVAQALQQLETELKVERLIDSPQVKVVAGTSTGAIIAAAIALGLSAKEIVGLYQSLGKAFSPKWAPSNPLACRLARCDTCCGPSYMPHG